VGCHWQQPDELLAGQCEVKFGRLLSGGSGDMHFVSSRQSRVFPVTSSVVSLYGVMLGHRGVTGLWGTGGLVWVAVTAAAYLAAGIAVFRLLERVTKARGALGAYR
jgi:hypothetical protein